MPIAPKRDSHKSDYEFLESLYDFVQECHESVVGSVYCGFVWSDPQMRSMGWQECHSESIREQVIASLVRSGGFNGVEFYKVGSDIYASV